MKRVRDKINENNVPFSVSEALFIYMEVPMQKEGRRALNATNSVGSHSLMVRSDC